MHPARRIAIVWPNAGALATSAPATLETALEVPADLVSSLADAAATIGNAKELAIVAERPGR